MMAAAFGEVLLAGGAGGAFDHGAAAGVVRRVADDRIDRGVEGGQDGEGVAGTQVPCAHGVAFRWSRTREARASR